MGLPINFKKPQSAQNKNKRNYIKGWSYIERNPGPQFYAEDSSKTKGAPGKEPTVASDAK